MAPWKDGKKLTKKKQSQKSKKYWLSQSIKILKIHFYNTLGFIPKRNNILVFSSKNRKYVLTKKSISYIKLQYFHYKTHILYAMYFKICISEFHQVAFITANKPINYQTIQFMGQITFVVIFNKVAAGKSDQRLRIRDERSSNTRYLLDGLSSVFFRFVLVWRSDVLITSSGFFFKIPGSEGQHL